VTKIKPFKHQTKSLKFAEKSALMFDMSDPGTGKTFVQAKRFEKRRAKRGGALLVMVPKSLIQPAWGNDLQKFTPDLDVSLAYAENRATAFQSGHDVYVTNHDAAKWLADQPASFFKQFDDIVVDEGDAYKHHTSQRTKALNKIKRHFEYRANLTATPSSNTITDLWAQAYFLDDGLRLGPSFFAFRNSVCIPTQVGPRREMIRWTDRPDAEEAVYGLIADITIRHRFEDCIDIPENHMYTMPFEMSTKQMKAYQQMEGTQMAWLGKQQAVTAINAASVTTKLLQIASGAVYESPSKYHLVDTARYELVMDLVGERKHSLVFFLWQHQRDFMIAEAKKRGITYAVIDGGTPTKQREDIVRDYQNGFYQVLLAHPQSAAHGLTLTRGTTTIWPSPTYNLAHFVQGNKRQHRAGQTQKTETIVILANNTIDQKVYHEVLVPKGQRMTSLLDLFTGAW
jgi:SNF2 family DNA or RNA helicase